MGRGPVLYPKRKAAGRRTTQIVIGFRRAPLLLFGEDMQSNITPNRLVIHVQPDEGITLDIHAKRPGPYIYIANVPLDFSYADFGEHTAATGYETLLYDCAIGDPTLFHRYDSVDASWRIVNPILDVWHALPARDFPNYPAGSWGPRRRIISLKRQATNGITITSNAKLGRPDGSTGAQAPAVVPLPHVRPSPDYPRR